jgi:glycosyltransferase involved in cell wall biosynthesis
MKILINTATLRFGGAIQVALSLICECRAFPEHEYHVFLGEGVGKQLNEEEFPINFHFYRFGFGPITLAKSRRIGRTLSDHEGRIGPDCVVTTSGPSYWRPRAPHLVGFNIPTYIYPDSPYIKKLSLYRKLRYKVKRILHFYFFRRDTDAFLVQTDDVKRRVGEAFGTDRVHIVSNTYNSFFEKPIEFSPKLPSRKPGGIRLLTLTSYYPHKNLEIIPKVLDEVERREQKDVHFVLTIDQHHFHRIIPESYHDRVTNVGPVPPAECPSLYKECDGLFQPTLAECFSASYPEAMIMQKPIVTTDLGFARDICGDAALYYRPMDPTEAANCIVRLAGDPKLREKLTAKGLMEVKKFDNARTRAQKILQICAKIRSYDRNEQTEKDPDHRGGRAHPQELCPFA